jgi:probable F420-dependent oxidoreductase
MADLVSFASRVEDLGFDSIWLGEHLLWRVGFLDPMVALAAISGVTQRIKLGTSVLILPLHHPLPLAKAATTLDILSHGRLILGVGVGGENPNEFAAVGIDVKQRGRLTNESLGLLRRLWTEDAVQHDGPAYPCNDATVRPRPLTPGGPPVWIGGRSEAAQQRAARLGDGWLPYLVSPRQYGAGIGALRATAESACQPLSDFTPALHIFVAIDGALDGRRLLGDFFERIYSDRLERVLNSTCLVGSVTDCAERLCEYWRAGARHFLLQVPGWGPETVGPIEEVANELLPLASRLIAQASFEVAT